MKLLSEGNYHIPDGSMRFLLTKPLLEDCMHQFNLSFLEPIKTVNVDDVRCMSTLMLQKKYVSNSDGCTISTTRNSSCRIINFNHRFP